MTPAQQRVMAQLADGYAIYQSYHGICWTWKPGEAAQSVSVATVHALEKAGKLTVPDGLQPIACYRLKEVPT